MFFSPTSLGYREDLARAYPFDLDRAARLLEEAGVPAGVCNVIPSRRSGAVVSAMLHDPRVRVVSFTGSTEVGRKLLHEAAERDLHAALKAAVPQADAMSWWPAARK